MALRPEDSDSTSAVCAPSSAAAARERRELEREPGRIDHGLPQDREVALLRARRKQAHLAAGERRLAHAVREDRRLVAHVAAGEQDRAQRVDLAPARCRGRG